MSSNKPRLLIAGSGALACLFAARLSAAGHPVQMLANWPAGVEALRRRGVGLVENETERYYPVEVVTDAGACSPVDFALVLVKSWQTERTAQQLAACLAPDGLALTLQNGLGNLEALASVLGPERVALGVTTSGATLLAPGLVRPGGRGPVVLAETPEMAQSLSPLAAWLHAAGFEIDCVPDAQALLWGKLVINAAINPLTALLGVPNGALLERPAARELLSAAAREAAAVAAAQGIPLPYPDPVQAAEDVARRTAQNRSSMLQDLERRAPTEIDAISGAVARLGEQFGAPAPVNWTLWKLVQAKVAQASAESQ